MNPDELRERAESGNRIFRSATVLQLLNEFERERTRAEKAEVELDKLKTNVTVFAAQLQAWGLDTAANEVITEILSGNVSAPDYYTLQARVSQAEAALIAMVRQYTQDGEEAVFTHRFMSAGEQAFRYLVDYGLAERRGYDIVLLKGGEE